MRNCMAKSGVIKDIFRATPGLVLRMQGIIEQMGLAGEGKLAQRRQARAIVYWLAARGELVKIGSGPEAEYSLGTRCGLAGKKKKATRTPAAASRLGLAPQPVNAMPRAGQPAQTVDEFLANGGKIQRLPASWDQPAQVTHG